MATKDFSSVQENMVASLLGWSVVAGSGAAACFPGDVIGDEWLGECKTHVEPGHKIQFMKTHWDKIKQEASVKHRFPILFTDDGTQKANHTWCLCMADRLEMDDIVIDSITKGVNKNILLIHQDLDKRQKDIVASNPGMHPIFVCNWQGDKVAICSLYTLVELIGE